MSRVTARAALLFIAAVATGADQPASDDPRRAQVQAAATNAAVNLREQVLRMPLTRGIDVRAVVDRTQTTAALDQALQGAQQIGGPRWIDDRTCQVRLEIPGSQLSGVLLNEVRQHADQSPLPIDELQRRLHDWDRITFYAVGSSAAGGEAIEMARPHVAVGAWAKVDEATRKRTITDARQDAVRHVLDDVAPVALSETVQVRDAIAVPAIGDRMNVWLNHQPVTRLEFLEDLKVSVTISPSPKAMTSTLQSAVTSDKEFSKNRTFNWGQVQQDVATRVGPTVGTAAAQPAPPAPAPQAPGNGLLPAMVLPLQPPDWIDSPIDAEATSKSVGTRLKTAQVAEAAATEQLRRKFLELHLTPQMTLGDAVKTDGRLGDAVDRAMLHARIVKVDYRPDGSVNARVRLDTQSAWDELRSNP
ncbi:MAG TPA: hypothetical protein VLI90_19335 [Tepidisphaeraceae bacterium]|nr:hypothetical protein [Tepidisphaeraceae bacterium]